MSSFQKYLIHSENTILSGVNRDAHFARRRPRAHPLLIQESPNLMAESMLNFGYIVRSIQAVTSVTSLLEETCIVCLSANDERSETTLPPQPSGQRHLPTAHAHGAATRPLPSSSPDLDILQDQNLPTAHRPPILRYSLSHPSAGLEHSPHICFELPDPGAPRPLVFWLP